MNGEMKFSLRAAREFNGLRQKEAAKALGITEDTLGKYENGKSYPKIPMLKKIEKLYHIPYHQLVFLPLESDLNVHY